MHLRDYIKYVMLLVLAVSGFGIITITPNQSSNELAVHFLDVGQGDAVLIQTPDGYEILVDGGASSQVVQAVAGEQGWNDRLIDIMIATHPDTDHVGGLNDILGRYDVPMIIQTEATSDSPAAIAFARAADLEKAQIIYARAGQLLTVGESTTIEVLAPASNTTNWRPNEASVIVRITFGDTAFMLTGDASTGIEDYLVEQYGKQLQSNVLKLGHHGSKTSTSELFLDTVQPQYAVVSAGIDNRYGHPDQAVMQRVFARGIASYHTGLDGTVSFYSDGVTVWPK